MRMGRLPENGNGAGVGKGGFYTRGWGGGKGRRRMVFRLPLVGMQGQPETFIIIGL